MLIGSVIFARHIGINHIIFYSAMAYEETIRIRLINTEYRKFMVQNYMVFYSDDEKNKTDTIARIIYSKRDCGNMLSFNLQQGGRSDGRRQKPIIYMTLQATIGNGRKNATVQDIMLCVAMDTICWAVPVPARPIRRRSAISYRESTAIPMLLSV